MSILYYCLAAVGTAALVLAVYNLIIFKRCRRRHAQSSPSSSSSSSSQPSNNRVTEVAVATRSNFDIRLSRNTLLSSFKYKKESEGEGGCECPVCLCGFEEGEEVRKLPRCKHRFHALCIDMWLFSHFDCPLCRTPVLQFCQLFPPPPPPATSREEGFLRSAINGGVSV